MPILTGRPMGAFLNPVATVAAIAPQLWIPTDEPSLLFWGDITDASTITSISGKVSEWRDKSGNNRHFSQSDAALRPELRTGEIVFANGVTDHLINASTLGLSGNPAVTTVFVAKTLDGSTYSRLFQVGINAGACLSNTLRTDEMGYRYNNGNCLFSGAPDNNYNIAGYRRTAGSTYGQASAFINGNSKTFVSSANSSTLINLNEPQSVIGHFASTDFFYGAIKSVLVFGSSDNALRQRAEGYLRHKYSTPSLVAGHPYESAPPT